jgi:hypothetical protein
MARNLLGTLVVLLALLFGSESSCAEKRVALVIGNSVYANTLVLKNPANDARAISDFLNRYGFDVTTVLNADHTSMNGAIDGFIKKLQPDDVALLYFAGHGLQFDGHNYLLATDARLMSEFDLDAEAVSLTATVQALERAAKVVLLFVDACRNNPLADQLASTAGVTRAAGSRGLARIEPSGAGTVIAFATQPGIVAQDGDGANSPYAQALIQNLAEPGVELSTAYKRVIQAVRKMTNDSQSPQIVSNLATEFYFDTSKPTGATGDFLTELDYGKAERIGTQRAWNLFLNKYQEGYYADLARVALTASLAADVGTLSPKEAEDSLKLGKKGHLSVEKSLIELGYSPGNPDGSFTKADRREIARYQKSLGIAETGYVTGLLLNRLKVPFELENKSLSEVSDNKARAYNPDDVKGLETDSRLLGALKCLHSRPVIYGFHRGHVYIAVLQSGSWEDANDISAKCSGHLVSITTEEENRFVYDLFSRDSAFIRTTPEYSRDPSTWRAGPWIGLVQDPAGREPAGGWQWVTGEPMTFKNWDSGQPTEDSDGPSDVAQFASNENQRHPDDIRPIHWADERNIGHIANGFVLELD